MATNAYEGEFPSGAGAGRAREPERLPPERSMGEIVKDIVANIQELIRSEIRLARVEMREKASATVRAGTMLIAGAVVACYAIAFLLVFVYHAIAAVTPAWAPALIVGFVLAAAALVMLIVGRNKIKRIHPAPERTVQSVREDVQWIRNRR